MCVGVECCFSKRCVFNEKDCECEKEMSKENGCFINKRGKGEKESLRRSGRTREIERDSKGKGETILE